jgi:hypothetical protein
MKRHKPIFTAAKPVFPHPWRMDAMKSKTDGFVFML